MILAGGDSTRFWPLKNKILQNFLGKLLIEHLVDQLINYAELVTIVVNKENYGQIKPVFNKKIQLLVQDPRLTGMGGAVLSAAKKIKGEVLVVNASDFFSPTLIKYLIKVSKDEEMILVGKKVSQYFPGGYFKFVSGQLKEIIEKPPLDNLPSDIVRLVADYFADFNQLIDGLTKCKGENDDHYERAVNYLLRKKIKTKVIIYDDFWYSLKFPWQILPLMSFFLKKINQNQIDKSAQISSTAVIRSPVYLGKNVRIGDFAKVVGPSYIDDNTIVADHTIIYQSHIGKGCLVGGYSEVTRSYLSEGVMLHRNYVGDSVMGKKVMLGAGATTANFRFDGQPIKDTDLIKLGSVIGPYSKIGVNATILPGIKIGSNSFVGPGEVVGRNLADNQFLFKNQIKTNKLKIIE